MLRYMRKATALGTSSVELVTIMANWTAITTSQRYSWIKNQILSKNSLNYVPV